MSRLGDRTNFEIDYRIPQMLASLGCMSFSPPLDNRIRQCIEIEPGHSWEIQLRGNVLPCAAVMHDELTAW